MNPNFLCCIGAELKNSTQQTTRMTQVYLYRAFEDETISDMLSPGFFDAALGIIRQDDLLLLYSPNETTAKYAYARVSNVDRDGVEINQIGIDAVNIIVDTTGFSKLTGGNLQEIIAQIDNYLDDILGVIPSDASSTNKLITESRLQDQISQRAVLKDSNVPQEMQSGLKTPEVEITNALVVEGTAEFEIAPLTDDLTTYNAATDDSLIRKAQVSEVKTDLEDKIDQAATSGKIIGSFWFGKTKAATTVPAPTIIGQNYYDFTTGNWYETTDGTTWVLGGTITPPADIDAQILITSLFWDIIEMDNQHGGKGFWSHTDDTWSYFPNIYEQQQAGSGVNIGDRFITTRLDNELNGAVECNGATYNASDVNGGENNIIQLLTDGKLDYVSMAAYTAEITAKGFCKHIGWDGTGSDTFRVPTLTPHIVQKNNIPVIGNNATPTFSNGSDITDRGLQVNGNSGNALHLSGSATATTSALVFGNESGLIADLTDVATTERVMIQLFNGATDEAVATCTSVLADVAELKYDYVVDFQRPTAQNNYTWYRLYKSGWVEQGGHATPNYSGQSISFPVEMSDTNYNVLTGINQTGVLSGTVGVIVDNKTATGMILYGNWNPTQPNDFMWQVSGMSAE